MNVAYPNGTFLRDFPLIESEVVSSLVERIVIDQGAIKMDSAHENLDGAHLVLDGVLDPGHSYLKITKQGVTLLNADYLGKLHCNADVTSPNIAAIETELANSTHLSTHGTIVKRNHTTTTTIQDLTSETMHADVIEIQDDVALYGDGTLTYTPQDPITGLNVVPAYTYRFGANSEALGDYTTRGDGLEFKEPDDAANGDRKNKVLIQVNSGTPTIELLVNKDAGEKWILIRDKDLLPVFDIDSAGAHVRTDEKTPVLLTPGNSLAVTTLTEGLQSHWFELNSAWTATTSETEIEISESTASTGARTIENVELVVDDMGLLAAIESRVYVKRWGVYRHTVQKVWVVLGLELRNSETSLTAGTLIRLNFNNKVVLT